MSGIDIGLSTPPNMAEGEGSMSGSGLSAASVDGDRGTLVQSLIEWQRAILESANFSIIATDREGCIVSFNAAAERMLGYAAGEVIGKQTPAIFHDSQEVVARAWQLGEELGEEILPGFEVFVAKARRGIAEELEWSYLRKDGSRISVLLSVTALRNSAGVIQGFLGIAMDISERKRLERTVAEAQARELSQYAQRLRLSDKVFEYSSEAIMVTDAEAKIINVNPAFTWLTGYRADEVIGRTPHILSSGRHDPAFYEDMWRRLMQEGQWTGEIWDRRKDGSIYPKWAVINAVRENGAITHYVALFSDISERKEHEERINYLAHHDHLTGLPNRLMFQERMSHALARAKRTESRLALVFIDLDRFKNINDSLGHHFGDQLLIQTAQRLKSGVRVSDTVARLGGDEFLVIFENAGDQNTCAKQVIHLRKTLEQPYVIDGSVIHAPPSIGVALYPEDGSDVETLMRHADTAMYQVKARGRNGWAFYAPRMNDEVQERIALERDLRLALERGEFLLHYQPQWDLDSDRLIGWEALVRWQHPERGLVAPDRFIPIAEETGLIVPLGDWVLETACAEVRAWERDGLGEHRIAVNLSARQFTQHELGTRVDAILAANHLSAGRLELEITESVLMEDAERTVDILRQLKRRGICIAIDDFGTGYSSLAYLKAFPVDKLKIDRSFVRDIVVDPNDAAIVAAIISMARSMGLATIAEGVESEGQRNFLTAQGCQALQGYLFGRPMSAADARHWMGCRETGTVSC
ncbi:MAG: EAL domain-containing protein [Dechloromonas sp.]|nr:MAG: EAL domain-containing protein [Dechloromonas sp.]